MARSGLADWVTDSLVVGAGSRGVGLSEREMGDQGIGEVDGDGDGPMTGTPLVRVKGYGSGDTTPWRLRDKARASGGEGIGEISKLVRKEVNEAMRE